MGPQGRPGRARPRLAANPGVEVVFTPLSETSTGVVNDVRELAEVAHRHGALIAVDAVSGLGAVPCPQDEWGVDVVVAGSQKALMAPPGLGFAEPQRGGARARRGRARGRFYFDWAPDRRGPAQGPARQPVHAGRRPRSGARRGARADRGGELDAGLRRHDLLGRATRAAAQALELELLGGDDEAANVVTAIACPRASTARAVPKLMRDRFGITIAGGQGRLKGKIARIAHCGYFGPFDIIVTVSALEMTLRELGHEVELGAGVAAAQRVLEAGVPVAA